MYFNYSIHCSIKFGSNNYIVSSTSVFQSNFRKFELELSLFEFNIFNSILNNLSFCLWNLETSYTYQLFIPTNKSKQKTVILTFFLIKVSLDCFLFKFNTNLLLNNLITSRVFFNTFLYIIINRNALFLDFWKLNYFLLSY